MKKRFIIFISTILILITSSLSVFALFSGVFRKYPTIITTTNISFLYNNKSYLDELNTDDLNIVKGEPTYIDLLVQTKGGEKVVTDYSINLYATEEETNTKLSEALDLYIYNGYRYEYVASLSSLTTNKSYRINGTTISNNQTIIKIALVYNEAINDTYYDASLNSTVVIRTQANAELSTSSNKYEFVSNVDEFKEALEKGKQIILTSNIEYNESINCENIGIDLNGHNLTLKGDNNTVNYTDSANSDLYFGSSTGSGVLTGNIIISSKAVKIHNNYINNFTYDKTDTSLLNDLYTKIENNSKELSRIKEYERGNTFNILDGYYLYSESITINSDVLTFDKTKNTLTINDYSSDNEIDYNYYVTINNKVINNQILLSDNSLTSVLNKLKTRLNGLVVNSSIPLLNYDNSSNSHIEYIINDGNGNNILTSDGIYQNGGLDYIKNMNSISVINPTIIVKITNEHDYLTYTINSNESINLIPLNEIQLRTLLISYTPNDLVNEEELQYSSLITTFKNKLNENISISEGTVTIDDNNAKDNITIDNTNQKITAKDLDLNEIKETTIIFSTNVNFNDIITYNLTENINLTLLGKEKYVTKYDISNRLKSKFNENDYINGTSYEFNGYGSLCPTVNGEPTPIYIKYTIETQGAENYVAIIYEYNKVDTLASQESYFIKTSSGYTFIGSENAIQAELNSESLYFIDISSIDGYDGEKYTISNGAATKSETGTYGILYKYEAFIKIKPNLVPQDEITYVQIRATLYSDVNYTTTYQDLSYTFTFSVEGIIHYGSNEGNIEDYFLYLALLKTYDINNDGLITYSESILNMSSLNNTYITTNNTYNLSYLNLNSINIKSLNGIENFANLSGISFDSSSIIDLSPLANLYNLKYLSASNNTISNIDSLNLSDELEYIDLSNNSITDISAFKYLTNIKYLNLNSNMIIDLDALTDMTNISYLNLSNMTKNGVAFTSDNVLLYELALTKVNSENANIYTGDNVLFELSNDGKVAVEILRELERINRVYKKLYLPSTYTNNTGTYTISWTTDNTNIITIGEVENGHYTYTINSPIVDQEMNFLIRVNSISYQRNMKVTVIKGEGEKYIYNPTSNSYVSITESGLVDENLINELFAKFNSVTSGTVNINGTEVSESLVISLADYNAINRTITTYDFSNKDITKLDGIALFKDYFDSANATLNFLGNKLENLSPLNDLGTINTLKIGSNSYDFNQLIDDNDNLKINITNLYISQCYDLNNEDVLSSIFRYFYLTLINNKTVKVYLKDDSTVWDPYTELLPYKLSYLPSTFTFKKLGSVDITNTNGLYDNDLGIACDFYGYTHYFKIDHEWVTTRNYRNSNNYFTLSNGTLTYNKYICGNEASYYIGYLKLYLNASTQVSTVSAYKYTVQINVLDYSKEITVELDNGDTVSLADMFGSKELKEEILSKLVTNNVISDDDLTITLEELNNLGISTFTFTQISSNTSDNLLTGLKYLTSLKTITINCDFNVGDGSDLINIDTLTVTKSYVNFKTLTTTLSNLRSINLSKINGFALKEGIGELIPNLESLKIDSTENNKDYELFDLHQLTYLIYEDSNKKNVCNLSYLYLNKINITYSGDNIYYTGLSAPKVSNIIVTLRNAYYNLHSEEPTYYIGSPSSNDVEKNNAAITFVCKANSTEIEYCYYSDTSNQWRVDTGADSSETIVVNPKIDDDRDALTDFGLLLTDDKTPWHTLDENNKTFVSKGTNIYLPVNTKYFWYSLQNDEKVYNNAYDIKWYVKVITANVRGESINKAESILIDNTATDGYMTYSLNQDAYYLIIGTIPKFSGFFIYQFISGEGDGIYSRFTNNNLRLMTYYFVDCDLRIQAWRGLSLEQSGINFNDFMTYGDSTLRSTGCTTWISSYVNQSKCIIYISSIEDYLKENNGGVIYNYVFGDSGKLNITYYIESKGTNEYISTLNLNNTKYAEFSPFQNLKHVTTLNLSDSYFKFESDLNDSSNDSFGNYTNLETINLTNVVDFTPTNLRSILTYCTSIKNITLTNTKCTNNYDTFVVLKEFASTKGSVNITLNGITSTISTITSQFNTILDTYITNKTYDINTTGSLANNLKNNSTYIDGNYTFKFAYNNEFITTIDEHDLTSSDGVVVNVLVTKSDFTMFTDVPFPFVFTNSKTGSKSNGQFLTDNGKKYIDELNYELIALCIQNGAIGYDETNGGFILTKDVTLSNNIATKNYFNNNNLSNFVITSDSSKIYIKLLSSSNYSIIINKSLSENSGTNALPGLYKVFESVNALQSVTHNNDTTFGSLTKDITYDFRDDDNIKEFDFTYYDNGSETGNYENILMFTTDVKYMYIDGVRYDLTLDFEFPDKETYGITIENNIITVNSLNLKNIAEGETITIKFKYTINNGITEKNIITLNITRGRTTDSYEDEYTLYVLLKKDESKTTDSYYLSINDETINNKKYFSDSLVQRVNIVGSDYILNDDGSYGIIDASYIFESGRFISDILKGRLINGNNNNVTNVANIKNSSDIQIGKLFTNIDTITELRIKNEDDYITSISGLEYFINLRILEINQNILGSIEPLKYLHLTNFFFGVKTNSVPYTMIEDFSPLIYGSKNTLTAIRYGGYSYTAHTDLSFLLQFSKLQSAYIENNVGWEGDWQWEPGTHYLYLKEFAYLIYQLKNKGVTVIISDLISSNYIIKYQDTGWHDHQWYYRFNDNFKEGADILSLFNTSEFKYSGNFLNDYLINVDINNDNNFYLPATIEDNGKLYLASYTTDSYNVSNNISNLGYYLLDTNGVETELTLSYINTKLGVTYDNYDKALEAYVNSATYYETYLAKSNVLYVKFNTNNITIKNDVFGSCGYNRISLSIKCGSGQKAYEFNRFITLNFN